jgi:hypothetical protein
MTNMLAIGGLLISVGLLTLAVLVPVFRRSDPPRWTTPGWIGEVVTVGLVSVLALGVACLAAGFFDALQAGPDILDIGLLAVVVVAAILIRPRLTAWARAKASIPAARVDVAAADGAGSRPVRASAPPAPDQAA